MKNSNGTIIYVGKAKDLKNRLSSYFKGTVTGKTKKMVSEVDHFEYVVTSSELEAFIVEINLIKKYDPKYNILLRDDKSYPYIELVKSPYPELRVVRYLHAKKNSNTKLYGPFPNVYAARRVVGLINRLYPLKKCKNMPKKECLYYHIGECLGYCIFNSDNEKISNMVQEIISILNGNNQILIEKIKEKMNFYSENMNYEMAKELKNELDYIKIVSESQKVELSDKENRDVINFYEYNSYISIQIFFIRNGKLLGHHNEIFQESDNFIDDIIEYISLFYKTHEVPKEIIVNDEIDTDILSKFLSTNVKHVQKGPKKQLLDLVKSNAKINLDNNLALIMKDEDRTIHANEELKQLLGLKNLNRIEIFDNSNLFGSYSVSGMVVFINGKPSKKDYRKFKISLEKNDDYHTMKEVIYRRYFRLMLEKKDMPDLIIVDGGGNQINAALDVINELNLSIPICGLKKDDHHRTNKLVNQQLEEIDVDIHSNLFNYLTRMQDEVHRFTINYHRQIRSKGSISSVLDEISGIGEKRKKSLIKKYGSIKNMKEQSVEELSSILPENIAKELLDYLKNNY